MARRYRLNNRMLKNIRKNDEAYQAAITDLKLLGKLTADEAKQLLGCEVPDYVELPAVPNESTPVVPSGNAGEAEEGDGEPEAEDDTE